MLAFFADVGQWRRICRSCRYSVARKPSNKPASDINPSSALSIVTFITLSFVSASRSLEDIAQCLHQHRPKSDPFSSPQRCLYTLSQKAELGSKRLDVHSLPKAPTH